MTPRQLEILQHALGLDQYGRGRSYRRHFVTGPGGTDYLDCQALMAAGLMTRRDGSPITGGSDVFLVTDIGRAAVTERSPAPPRPTAAQRRYRRFLDADGAFGSFRDFLMHEGQRNG